jgi:hypothetical protein
MNHQESVIKLPSLMEHPSQSFPFRWATVAAVLVVHYFKLKIGVSSKLGNECQYVV